MFEENSLRAVKDWQFELSGKPYERSLKYKFDYKTNLGFDKNKRLIRKLEKKALDGEASAQYYYAKLNPMVFPKEKFNPTKWYYEAALQGNSMAQFELANNLLEGKGCKEDAEKAINWLVNSASKNLGRSQFKLANVFFENGELEKGKFWLRKAIMAKDPEIALELAQYIDAHNYDGFSEHDVISQLDRVNYELMGSPISYFELYAKTYASLGDYKNAVKYQKKAHFYYREVGRVPEIKQKTLAQYEYKLNSEA